MRASLYVAGLAIALSAVLFGLNPLESLGQEKDEKDCAICLEKERIKKQHEAGRISEVEWIDRRLALLEGGIS